MVHHRPSRAAIAISLVLCLTGIGRASADAGGEVEEVEACVRENLPDDSSIQTVVMTSHDRIGAERRLEAKIYWQQDDSGKSKALMEFSNPPDMRDSILLVIELDGANDMFMYLPDLGKARRVTTHMVAGSMFGTDFSYEDFERVQGMSDDTSSELLEDAEVAGRKTWVLASFPPKDEGSGYEKILSYVDQEMCVALKVEFFEKGDKLRKLLEVDASKIEQKGDIYVPTVVSMIDLRDETKTALLVEEIEIHAKIPRSRFSLRRLETGR